MADYFLWSIKHLHQHEEMMLYGNLLQISVEEASEVSLFLKGIYEQEATDYPYNAPIFDAEAALWGAKIIYTASQLLLYRENKDADIEQLLPSFSHTITASAMLSADLSLRFLTDIIYQLKLIDPEDKLIESLETHLQTWHYSGVSYPLSVESLDFEIVTANPSLYQLYLNRVTAHKNVKLAKHPALIEGIRANLGMFAQTFWKELN
jgi:hypothetical protein